MKKLKLDKLEVEFLYSSYPKVEAFAHLIETDLEVFVALAVAEFYERFLQQVNKKGVQAVKSATMRRSEIYGMILFFRDLGISVPLADITRNNLIEKLYKLYKLYGK